MKPRVLSFLLISLMGFPEPAKAEVRQLHLYVVSLPLSEVVDTLSLMSGVPVTKIGTPEGMVERWSVTGDSVSAFEALGEVGNLFVAFDGSRVIVSSRDEVTTTVFDGFRGKWHEAESAIESLFPRYPEGAVQYDMASSTVIVRGPSEFAQAVEAIINRPISHQVKLIRGGKVEVINPDVE